MSHATNGHGPSLAIDVLDGLVTPSVRTSRHVGEEDWRRYEGYVAEILGSFGLDLSTPGTADTPRRFLRAIHSATDGYDGDPKLLTAFPTECRGGTNCEFAQVVEGPIPFVGLCEHLGLVEGVGFPPELAPWARLRTVMRSQDHLFLRYVLNGSGWPTGGSSRS